MFQVAQSVSPVFDLRGCVHLEPFAISALVGKATVPACIDTSQPDRQFEWNELVSPLRVEQSGFP
jgi:hypothetical protein